MGFSRQFVAAIAFSLLVRTFGELILVQHPLVLGDDKRELTCMSEDDDAALVWNHELDINESNNNKNVMRLTDFLPRLNTWYNVKCAIWNSTTCLNVWEEQTWKSVNSTDVPTSSDLTRNNESTSFYPKKSLTENIAKCAVSNSTGCFIQWKNISEWNPVNSAVEPMGPVLDYRWEGFEEIVFPKDGYQNVHGMNSRSGSVVFSVRASQHVHLIMCEKKDRPIGQCLWIIIGVLNFKDSAIRSCVERPQDSEEFPRNLNCSSLIREKLLYRQNVYPDEWRTFRIRWDADPKVIQIFNHTESKPFMKGSLEQWNPTSPTLHMMTKIDGAARIRFHLYDYWRTRNENVSISTAQFNTDDVIFHVHLLVGLCQGCQMKIDLIDKNGRRVTTNTSIIENRESTSSDLLNWQSVEIKWNLQDVDRNNLKLKIQTILTEKRATGRWAIGNIRLSKSVDGVRKSTITIDNKMPLVKCQKISYNDNAIVDPAANGTLGNVSTELQQYIYQLIESCNSVCNYTGNWTVCGPTGCMSRPGFTLDNCINGKPRFEIVPGDRYLTVNKCSPSTTGDYTLEIRESMAQGPSKRAYIPYESAKLKSSTEYTVKLVQNDIAVITTQIRTLSMSASSKISTMNMESESDFKKRYLAWLIVPLAIIICLFLLIWFRKRRRADPGRECEAPMVEMDHLKAEHPREEDTVKPLPTAPVNPVSIGQSSLDKCDPHSCPVKIEEFEKYTKDALASKLLDSQFTKFVPGLTKPCESGTLPENVVKNRYQDQIPYDDTRVILKEINDDPNSDYINASYIRGYGKSKAYIATQGPKTKTVKDFWRMIWQERVGVICMLANVVEDKKIKCEQYWPEIGTKVTYGSIRISNTGHQVFADYTFRTLTVRCEGDTREVMHLHYTGWPDHGVPMYTQSLVSYLKKLLATSVGPGPIVVHCSAGVGRTGTIILCAICLSQAVAERVIDVPAVLVRMREDRANMVANAQQYLLVHLAIVESMIVQQTQIPCDDFLPVKIQGLKKQLPSDIQRLKDAVWQDRVLHSLAATRSRNQKYATDKSPEKVPGDSMSAETNRMNAVSVDGVRMKLQYLASKLPSSSTIPDFWALIAEKRIELVVVLQKDPNSCGIIPRKSTIIPLPSVQVEIKQSPKKQGHFTTSRLTLTETVKGEARTQPVTVLACTGWGQGKKGKPPSAAALVSLWLASEKVSRKEGPTLVLCQDGVTGCGLYLALNFLLERMTVEGECDVISAVRAVRRSETEFVQSLGQFQHLYDVAVNYRELFKTYANFS